MPTTTEIPILTSRTLELFANAIPADTHRALRDSLERIKPVFASFFTDDSMEVSDAFLIAASRYAHPRLQLLLLLASVISPNELPRLIDEIANYESNMLAGEGRRLGKGIKPLRSAWETYKKIGQLLRDNLSVLDQTRNLPYGWLMASTKMDFSLTATAMYLEGDFPNASQNRLAYLCRAAQDESANVMTILLHAFYPLKKEHAAQALGDLFGSWQGDDRVDEDLNELYESRRYRSNKQS